MSTIDAATVFDGCRERLQRLLGDHVDIGVVERAIASYPLDEDEKAALWLWALAPSTPPRSHPTNREAAHDHHHRSTPAPHVALDPATRHDQRRS